MDFIYNALYVMFRLFDMAWKNKWKVIAFCFPWSVVIYLLVSWIVEHVQVTFR